MNNRHWLESRFILYRVFTNLFFLSAVWLYFYRLFVTDEQVGFLDGMAFAIGLIAEVPSGALADKFGRDKIVKLGQIMFGAGLLIQAFGSSFVPFFVGQSIVMIGAAFASGADDALFYKKLNYRQNSIEWRKLTTRATQISLIANVLAILIGGLLQSVNPRLPWILTGLSFFIAVILIWPITETERKKTQQRLSSEIKDYLKNISIGFKQFLLPKLWLYLPIIVVVQGLFYLAGWGLLRVMLLDRFGFNPFLGSVAIASSSLITVGILTLMHKYANQLSEKKVIVIISLCAASSLLLAIANIGMWGYVVILTLYAGEHLLYPFMSEVLNKQAPEEQRATVLSVGNFLRILPYVILAPIIGYLNTNNQLQYFLFGWAIMIVIAVLIYVSAKKHDSIIKTGKEDAVKSEGDLEVATQV